MCRLCVAHRLQPIVLSRLNAITIVVCLEDWGYGVWYVCGGNQNTNTMHTYTRIRIEARTHNHPFGTHFYHLLLMSNVTQRKHRFALEFTLSCRSPFSGSALRSRSVRSLSLWRSLGLSIHTHGVLAHTGRLIVVSSRVPCHFISKPNVMYRTVVYITKSAATTQSQARRRVL